MKDLRVRDESPVSFLSRLRGRRPSRELTEDQRFEREVLAIRRNLEAVFNTRKGSGSVVSAYGLGDYEGKVADDGTPEPLMGTKDILAVLEPEIERQVRSFEPRIVDPSVERLGRDHDMRAAFAVKGAVAGRPVRFRIALHTIFHDVTVDSETKGVDEEG